MRKPQQTTALYRREHRECHRFRHELSELLENFSSKTFIPELAKIRCDHYDRHVIFHIDIPLDVTYKPTGEFAPPDEGCFP